MNGVAEDRAWFGNRVQFGVRTSRRVAVAVDQLTVVHPGSAAAASTNASYRAIHEPGRSRGRGNRAERFLVPGYRAAGRVRADPTANGLPVLTMVSAHSRMLFARPVPTRTSFPPFGTTPMPRPPRQDRRRHRRMPSLELGHHRTPPSSHRPTRARADGSPASRDADSQPVNRGGRISTRPPRGRPCGLGHELHPLNVNPAARCPATPAPKVCVSWVSSASRRDGSGDRSLPPSAPPRSADPGGSGPRRGRLSS